MHQLIAMEVNLGTICNCLDAAPNEEELQNHVCWPGVCLTTKNFHRPDWWLSQTWSDIGCLICESFGYLHLIECLILISYTKILVALLHDDLKEVGIQNNCQALSCYLIFQIKKSANPSCVKILLGLLPDWWLDSVWLQVWALIIKMSTICKGLLFWPHLCPQATKKSPSLISDFFGNFQIFIYFCKYALFYCNGQKWSVPRHILLHVVQPRKNWTWSLLERKTGIRSWNAIRFYRHSTFTSLNNIDFSVQLFFSCQKVFFLYCFFQSIFTKLTTHLYGSSWL